MRALCYPCSWRSSKAALRDQIDAGALGDRLPDHLRGQNGDEPCRGRSRPASDELHHQLVPVRQLDTATPKIGGGDVLVDPSLVQHGKRGPN